MELCLYSEQARPLPLVLLRLKGGRARIVMGGGLVRETEAEVEEGELELDRVKLTAQSLFVPIFPTTKPTVTRCFRARSTALTNKTDEGCLFPVFFFLFFPASTHTALIGGVRP